MVTFYEKQLLNSIVNGFEDVFYVELSPKLRPKHNVNFAPLTNPTYGLNQLSENEIVMQLEGR